MFGKVREVPQSETTPFYPRSPYGVAKLGAYWMTVNYRESYDMFACNGILFNHESPLRGEEFVTRKIIKGLVRVSLGLQEHIEMGNLDAQRDWGHAKDYTYGMYKMLQQETPDDYVLATGNTYSVEEFIGKVCWQLELNPDEVVKINPKFFRPAEVDLLLGNPTKAMKKLNWKNTYTLDSMIEEMIAAEVERESNAR